MTGPATSRGVLLVLVSWRPDAPAGIERATAALAAGLAEAGHRPVIATAAPQPDGPTLPGVTVERLRLDNVTFPCEDDVLRRAVTGQDSALARQIRDLITTHRIDTVLFTDALWGLGRLRGDFPGHVRRALAAHVKPAVLDAGPAFARATRVLVPSDTVLGELTGWQPRNLRVVPNALLPDPVVLPPGPDRREELRRRGPVRVLARLGPEKGVLELLETAAGWDRPVEVALAEAGFEASNGSQAALLDQCRKAAARTPGMSLRGALAWHEVLPWLAGAAVVIVPSHRETFGLVALEAMSVGTPVVAYRVGNLPALIEPTGHGGQLLVAHDAGPAALHKTAQALLEDDILYGATTQTVYRRADDFAPHRIANLFLEAVS
ncbi:glycosyltransferase family 4 protein [Kitasatospora purpeofusca]|uniref:glycosyltransferase family 4 protein n=1 Tax=Kitasatospora purpeofusca TaxID=67352 RepID=UPI00224F0484|nr:glycosyltransferase family 4 protein [Kitasatospora purpeofusca]MCX4758659.1 glycosyltransferase family 4 protein [Kitasatospora purpeofusca]WSR30906.1 glycosyltransferase family 4 protein [Kitasatospora purpeofusca]